MPAGQRPERREMRRIRQRNLNGFPDAGVQAYETAHRQVARRAAAEGMVLLKNADNVLPLAKGSKVALFGAGASQTVKGGTGSGEVNERTSVSIWQGMKNAGFEITDEDWLASYDRLCGAARLAWKDEILKNVNPGDFLSFFDEYSRHPFEYPAGDPIAETEADTAVYIISRVAGENADRRNAPGDYQLTEEEKKAVAEVCRLYSNVIVAVNAGGLIDLGFMDEYPGIKALLYIVQPGTEGGNAFADVLSGAVTPSGKLSDTWALRFEDYPNAGTFSYLDGNVWTERYIEGIYNGYRYFDSFQVPVRYSFGFGLSYTTFASEMRSVAVTYPETADCRYGSQDPGKEPFVQVEVKIENTGRERSGRESAQVYVSCPDGRLEKEARRLAGFAKTKELMPGESEILKISFPLYALASYDEKLPGYVLEKGSYGIWTGSSLSRSVLSTILTMEEERVLVHTQNICRPEEETGEISLPADKRKLRYLSWADSSVNKIVLQTEKLTEQTISYDRSATLAGGEAADIAAALNDEEMISLVVGDPGKGQGGVIGSAGTTVPGAAGETGSLAKEKGVASIVLSDGPAGLRLEKEFRVENGQIVPGNPMDYFVGGLFAEKTPPAAGQSLRYQYCTAFPVGTLLAQTFDPELVSEVGQAVAEEMKIFNITLWLAPGMCIHRNPLCGRNFEYYSEDPVLSGTMAAAMTNGVQSVSGCGTTIKHFAGNNQEDNRMGSNDVISERALREIYLKGFEIAVKTSHPMSMMTSYNLINGVHSANNADLCTKAARCEWGFDGFIMTDWTTTTNSTDEVPCTASGCIRAGNDVIMPGAESDFEDLRTGISDGSLSREDLRDCAARVIGVVLRSNEYEQT